ncbi:hypothetical protein [Photobacterium carnosum]|uniref:hypothetical protein n=1 Tax=Photobacterium carnosum TaxID=2023717 RepID=UPI00242F02EA|nr:hypothetical protein [Photobacterium carnosum]
MILHSKAFLLVGKPIHVAAYGIVSYTEAFFYLINPHLQPKEASLLTGGKLLLISIAIFVLAYSIGVNGVWLALPICSAALTLWIIFRLRMLSITN